MDDSQFWVSIWAIVAVCFVGLVTAITSYEMRSATILAQALKDNPQRTALDVSCGLNYGNPDVCAIRAAAAK